MPALSGKGCVGNGQSTARKPLAATVPLTRSLMPLLSRSRAHPQQFCLLVLSNLAVVPAVRLSLRLGAATGAAPAVVLGLNGAASALYHMCDLEVSWLVLSRRDKRGGHRTVCLKEGAE